jgi:hypothetical protein
MINKFKRFYSIDQSEVVEVPPGSLCYIHEITVLVPETIVFTYNPCVGEPTSVSLNGDGVSFPRVTTVCSIGMPLTGADSSKYEIFIQDDCGKPPS